MCKTVLFSLLLLTGCSDRHSEVLTQDYPQLYEYVLDRDADGIMDMTSHSESQVRAQAWRALVSTSVDSLQLTRMIDMVLESDNDLGWYALSFKELSPRQLRMLEQQWESKPSMRGGIAKVLGLQGDEASFEFLLNKKEDMTGRMRELDYSQALGRLNIDNEADEELELWLTEQAIRQQEELTGPAYLFAYYRTGRVLSSDSALSLLWNAWREAETPMFRQYALKILLNDSSSAYMEEISVMNIQEWDPQEASVLASSMIQRYWNGIPVDIWKKLLRNENPVVNQFTLDILSGKEGLDEAADQFIKVNIIDNEEKEYAVRLAGIQALSDPSPFVDSAREWAAKDDYLMPRLLGILEKSYTPSEYFLVLSELYKVSAPLETYFIISNLAGWWTPLSDADKEEVGFDKVRELVMDALYSGNRSLSFALGSVLMDENLIRDRDYKRIEESLQSFRLPADVEVYQAFSAFFYNRFEEQAVNLIDSLSAYGNVALNRTLAEQGWDIQNDADEPVDRIEFREPDWTQQAKLAKNPVWKLETTKGSIMIILDVMTAPATLSGMKYLSDSGAYNGVAFHRVVPNFVIQGGDIETGNGMGGPDYVVPTESSEKQYRRGVVGIASAGTDTEGSQYFIMHKWDPRLNGAYTVIGEVLEGMDVVDRIVVGDRVLSSVMGGGSN